MADRWRWLVPGARSARRALRAAMACALLPCALLLVLLTPGAGHASDWAGNGGPSVSLVAEQPLRFGTMVVAGTGARTVLPSGGVVNADIFPMGYNRAGPAQFTLTYDRGEAAVSASSLLLQLTLPAPDPVTLTGVSGQLSRFETDLPGVPVLIPGDPVTYTMGNCAARICSLTFHVGARLDVSASSSRGAPVIVNLPLTAQVLTVMQ